MMKRSYEAYTVAKGDGTIRFVIPMPPLKGNPTVGCKGPPPESNHTVRCHHNVW